eukprot:snap_masked-scaffold_17-processed-gene-0.24-mRNA-1 protein AED:1.00 eAED:1.00 QI:0/0/0/0/1/1/2/0/69
MKSFHTEVSQNHSDREVKEPKDKQQNFIHSLEVVGILISASLVVLNHFFRGVLFSNELIKRKLNKVTQY